MRQAWPGVAIRRLNISKKRIEFGDSVRVDATLALNQLTPKDVVLELLLCRAGTEGKEERMSHRFVAQDAGADGEHHFTLELAPQFCGKLDMRIRAYPCHESLTHPLELGLMIWA